MHSHKARAKATHGHSIRHSLLVYAPFLFVLCFSFHLQLYGHLLGHHSNVLIFCIDAFLRGLYLDATKLFEALLQLQQEAKAVICTYKMIASNHVFTYYSMPPTS